MFLLSTTLFSGRIQTTSETSAEFQPVSIDRTAWLTALCDGTFKQTPALESLPVYLYRVKRTTALV